MKSRAHTHGAVHERYTRRRRMCDLHRLLTAHFSDDYTTTTATTTATVTATVAAKTTVKLRLWPCLGVIVEGLVQSRQLGGSDVVVIAASIEVHSEHGHGCTRRVVNGQEGV